MEPLTLIQGRQQRLSQSFRAPSTADPTYLISPVAIHEAAGGIRGLFGVVVPALERQHASW